MTYGTVYNSPLGALTLISDGENLCGVWFEGQRAPAFQQKDLPVLHQTEKWLDAYFEGKRPNSVPPISFGNATPFRLSVWQALLQIPYGTTVTYGQLAKQLRPNAKLSAQAVGNAVGANPISIIVPCHRVVGTDGKLVGYAAGVDKKTFLLNLEGVEIHG